jgi:hypothetical protein
MEGEHASCGRRELDVFARHFSAKTDEAAALLT